MVRDILRPDTRENLLEDVRSEHRIHQFHDPSQVSTHIRIPAYLLNLVLAWLSSLVCRFRAIMPLLIVLGTGNATPDLPSIMMERLYTSPTYGMWYPIDDKSLSSNLPPMVVFPETSEFFGKWGEELKKRGVKVSLKSYAFTCMQVRA